MLKIWGRRNSINVQKVMWTVGELSLEHEHIDAGGEFGGLDTPQFRTMNPHGLVPVIDDGGVVVWESHAIVRYLAARYGAGNLWPQDPPSRSYADRWMDWTIAELQPAFMQLFFLRYRTPDAKRNWKQIEQSLARCAQIFIRLDRILSGRSYIIGPKFSMGDIPAGTLLYRYFSLDMRRPPTPHLEAWYERLTQRPAYREHVMRPFEDLEGQG